MPWKKLGIITVQIKTEFGDEEDVMELVMAGTWLHAINYLFIVSSASSSLSLSRDIVGFFVYLIIRSFKTELG